MSSVTLRTYIRDWMARENMTLTEFAEQAGSPKQTISNYLNNPKTRPDLPTYVGIAQALGRSLADVLELDGYVITTPSAPDEESLRVARQIDAFPWLRPVVDELLALDERDRGGILAFLEALRRQRDDK